jgi:hypothetical protein
MGTNKRRMNPARTTRCRELLENIIIIIIIREGGRERGAENIIVG